MRSFMSHDDEVIHVPWWWGHSRHTMMRSFMSHHDEVIHVTSWWGHSRHTLRSFMSHDEVTRVTWLRSWWGHSCHMVKSRWGQSCHMIEVMMRSFMSHDEVMMRSLVSHDWGHDEVTHVTWLRSWWGNSCHTMRSFVSHEVIHVLVACVNRRIQVNKEKCWITLLSGSAFDMDICWPERRQEVQFMR